MKPQPAQLDVFGGETPIDAPEARKRRPVHYFDPTQCPTPGSELFERKLREAITEHTRDVDALYRMREARHHWKRAALALTFWHFDQLPEELRWALCAGEPVTLRVESSPPYVDIHGETFTLVVPDEVRDLYRDAANLYEEEAGEDVADPSFGFDRRLGAHLRGEDYDEPDGGR